MDWTVFLTGLAGGSFGMGAVLLVLWFATRLLKGRAPAYDPRAPLEVDPRALRILQLENALLPVPELVRQKDRLLAERDFLQRQMKLVYPFKPNELNGLLRQVQEETIKKERAELIRRFREVSERWHNGTHGDECMGAAVRILDSINQPGSVLP